MVAQAQAQGFPKAVWIIAVLGAVACVGWFLYRRYGGSAKLDTGNIDSMLQNAFNSAKQGYATLTAGTQQANNGQASTQPAAAPALSKSNGQMEQAVSAVANLAKQASSEKDPAKQAILTQQVNDAAARVTNTLRAIQLLKTTEVSYTPDGKCTIAGIELTPESAKAINETGIQMQSTVGYVPFTINTQGLTNENLTQAVVAQKALETQSIKNAVANNPMLQQGEIGEMYQNIIAFKAADALIAQSMGQAILPNGLSVLQQQQQAMVGSMLHKTTCIKLGNGTTMSFFDAMNNCYIDSSGNITDLGAKAGLGRAYTKVETFMA